jgi:hypothetical protein
MREPFPGLKGFFGLLFGIFTGLILFYLAWEIVYWCCWVPVKVFCGDRYSDEEIESIAGHTALRVIAVLIVSLIAVGTVTNQRQKERQIELQKQAEFVTASGFEDYVSKIGDLFWNDPDVLIKNHALYEEFSTQMRVQEKFIADHPDYLEHDTFYYTRVDLAKDMLSGRYPNRGLVPPGL